MSTKDRRARERQGLRQQILDAARDILIRDGYDGLSMRRVAERIDYSPTAIYLHFRNKQELVFSLCDETFARLARELDTLQADHPDPLVRLRKGMERYIAFGLKNPNHYVPAFILPHPEALDPKRRAEIVAADSNALRALGTLRTAIADCVKAKKIRKVDPDITARAFWTALHGITSALIVHSSFPWGDPDKVVRALLDALLDGVKR
jgi:AcrR family transcriptional regulator